MIWANTIVSIGLSLVVIVAVSITFKVTQLYYKRDIYEIESRIKQYKITQDLSEHAYGSLKKDFDDQMKQLNGYQELYYSIKKQSNTITNLIEKRFSKEELDALCVNRRPHRNYYPK